MRRKTKIICTIGPASGQPEVLRRMVEKGMDVARINFSHGTWETNLAYLQAVRDAAASFRKPVAILGDLQGPKIRIGSFGGEGKIVLEEGDPFTIDPDVELGDRRRVGATYRGLAENLKAGEVVLLADGMLRLRVEAIEGLAVRTRVEVGGELSSHKGVNLPGVRVNLPAMTEKDERDLEFIIDHGFDYVALSFVQTAEDVRRLKALIRRKKHDLRVIAKIEKPQALDQLDEILAESDGVMVARGDMGVELDVERVPPAQKTILSKATAANVLSITATQMLESMTHSPIPTRAEASDVANAVYDGTDAVMLSGETAVGEYPVESVAMMARIALQAEQSVESWSLHRAVCERPRQVATEAICRAAVELARDLEATAIVVGSQTGYTSFLMSKLRPPVPVMGISSDERALRRMAAMYGVCPVRLPRMDDMEESIALTSYHLLSSGLAREGDAVVMTFGAPLAERGKTNTVRFIRVGEPRRQR